MTTSPKPISDTAALAAIGAATRDLQLPRLRVEAARGFLAEALSVEVDHRSERRRQRRVQEAKFPRIKRLADYDPTMNKTVNPATIATLATGAYLTAGEPVVLLGDSGTGKTHLLIGLGIAACEQGKRVRYITAAQLVNELVEAADERKLSRLVNRYGRDTRGAELLFQILTEREEKASIATASNLPFSEWGKIITDPRLVAAIVDRVTFHAHIIETGTDSYRLQATTNARISRR
jgi:DNA replication protein DnaC